MEPILLTSSKNTKIEKKYNFGKSYQKTYVAALYEALDTNLCGVYVWELSVGLYATWVQLEELIIINFDA